MKIGDIVKVKVINITSKNEYREQIFKVIGNHIIKGCFNAERLDNKLKVKIDKDGFPIFKVISEKDVLEYITESQ